MMVEPFPKRSLTQNCAQKVDLLLLNIFSQT